MFELLFLYFKNRIVFCDPDHETGFDQAGRNQCACRSTPCIKPETNLAKNHELELARGGNGIPYFPDQRYLFQYRNPVRSLVSLYELQKFPADVRAREHWEAYALANLDHWKILIDRWPNDLLKRHDPKLYVIVAYEQLVGDPGETGRRVIEMMTDERLDEERLALVLDQVKIRPLDRIRQFSFYDEEFFARIEEAAGDHMRLMNVPSFRDSV